MPFWKKTPTVEPLTPVQRRGRACAVIGEAIDNALTGNFDKRSTIFGLADDLENWARQLRARML